MQHHGSALGWGHRALPACSSKLAASARHEALVQARTACNPCCSLYNPLAMHGSSPHHWPTQVDAGRRCSCAGPHASAAAAAPRTHGQERRRRHIIRAVRAKESSRVLMHRTRGGNTEGLGGQAASGLAACRHATAADVAVGRMADEKTKRSEQNHVITLIRGSSSSVAAALAFPLRPRGYCKRRRRGTCGICKAGERGRGR